MKKVKWKGLLTIEQLINGFKKLTGVQVNMNIIHSETEVWKLNEPQTFAIYRIMENLCILPDSIFYVDKLIAQDLKE